MNRINTNQNVDRPGAVELHEYSQTHFEGVDIPVTSIHDDPPESVTQSLLPCDGGKAAWRLLISAFVFEALLWGT